MKEMLIPRPDDAGWVTVPKTGGMRVYTYWEDKKTGASIALLDVPEGAEIPVRHRHASNQFMYCIEGTYAYLDPGLILEKGTFYMNPKGNPHGPTLARTRCLLLEIYDGPHYFELPSFHTKDTVGKIAGKKPARAGKRSSKKPPVRAKSARPSHVVRRSKKPTKKPTKQPTQQRSNKKRV
jgi:quercetin dioxygenase-like cupin family protein